MVRFGMFSLLGWFVVGCGSTLFEPMEPLPSSTPAMQCMIEGQPAAGISLRTEHPPTDGPPSELLATALKLYQQERYQEAAGLFRQVLSGSAQDAPASVQRAEFHLAKCVYHTEGPQSSRVLFEHILANVDHLYRRNALEWICRIQGQVPPSQNMN